MAARTLDSARDACPDVAPFIEQLEATGGYFEPGTPVSIGRAPGRLDVMGGIADYSGSLVLQMPIAEAALVAVQLLPSRAGEAVPGARVRIMSTLDKGKKFELPLGSLYAGANGAATRTCLAVDGAD